MTSEDVRARLAVALDVAEPAAAIELARRHRAHFGVAKVGLELWAAGGPTVLEPLQKLGFRVFCDLKLHDIPNQVGRAARVLGRAGVAFVTMHASGGVDMLRAGVEGLRHGASDAGHAAPTALGVTVLTSEPDADAFASRLAVAMNGGCNGIVCSVAEAPEVKRVRADLFVVTPGIRLTGSSADDQARTGDPGAAIRAGADLLVVGRTVTAADDPGDAAEAVARAVASALAAPS